MLELPSSSYAWIRYMAFHVGLGEVRQARATAERALRTIHYRQQPIFHSASLICFFGFEDTPGAVMLSCYGQDLHLLLSGMAPLFAIRGHSNKQLERSAGYLGPVALSMDGAGLQEHACRLTGAPRARCAVQGGAREAERVGGLAESGESIRRALAG